MQSEPGVGSGDGIKQLAFDEENNIYCLGMFYTEDMGTALLLIKLDQNGNMIWERRYEGRIGSGGRRSNRIIVNNDQILIAGYTYAEGSNNRNFLLLEYDTSGQFLQEIDYPGSNPEGDDFSANMVLDDYGNIFIAGRTTQRNRKLYLT